MQSRDNDQRVLDVIEDQLRTEDPGFVGNFSDFGGITPWIKLVKGRDHATTGSEEASRGRRWRANREVHEIVSQLILVIIVSMLVVAFVAGLVWWMLTALGQ